MTTANITVMNLRREKTNRGWIFYDGECPLCIASAKKFAPLLNPYGFRFMLLQTCCAQERLGLKLGEPLMEMKLLTDDGKIFGGADAVLQIARKIWWACPLFVIAQIPGAKIFLRAIYRQIAANRYCFGGVCSVPKNFAHRHLAFFEMP